VIFGDFGPGNSGSRVNTSAQSNAFGARVFVVMGPVDKLTEVTLNTHSGDYVVVIFLIVSLNLCLL
jgi:hypothetical protein